MRKKTSKIYKFRITISESSSYILAKRLDQAIASERTIAPERPEE
jgi:hypothetical protein